jgi:hypothetical protein
MKVFGRPAQKQKQQQDFEFALSEVTLTASVQELDLIIRFLSHVSERFAKPGKATDHCHINEVVEWHSQWPDIIVKNPRT